MGELADDNEIGGEVIKRRNRFAIAATISFLLGLVILFLERWIPRPIPIIVFTFLSFLLAPLLCVTWILTSFRRMSIVGKVLGVGLIPFLSVVIFLNVRVFLMGILPYIYCPPALTPDKLPVFNECIAFAQTRNEDKTLGLGIGLWVTVDGNPYKLSKGNSFERNRAEKALTQGEISQMEDLCRKLYGVKCALFRRHGDLLLFYNMTNCVAPMFAPGWSFFPVSPGVLYSLSGENPNKVNDEFIDSLKPFFKIKGNWYMSRCLVKSPPRYSSGSIPKALFDHSLRLNGINFEKEFQKSPEPVTSPADSRENVEG
jgi:hypothetical protein